MVSRLRQKPEESAKEAFLREIRTKQGYYNLRTQRELAESAGVSQTTIGRRIREPDDFTVAELRGVVTAINPDPAIVLALLGYSRKEIRNYLREQEETA